VSPPKLHIVDISRTRNITALADVLREMHPEMYFEGSGTAWFKRKCTCNGAVFTSLGIRLCMSSMSTSLRECDTETGTASGDARKDFYKSKINQ